MMTDDFDDVFAKPELAQDGLPHPSSACSGGNIPGIAAYSKVL